MVVANRARKVRGNAMVYAVVNVDVEALCKGFMACVAALLVDVITDSLNHLFKRLRE
jgi:hypothetical protein